MTDPAAASDVGGRQRVSLFGVPVDALTMDETVEAARAMVRTATPHQHVVLNAAKLVQIDRDPRLRQVVEGCALVNADGMSVVWAARLLRRPLPERVTGIELFERLVESAQRDGSSVYFLGATAEVVERVVDVFKARYPGLRVAGYHSGFWEDDQVVVQMVRATNPDYLFLGIPSPLKEFWLNEHLDEMGVPFIMGVGGSFDVVAGKISRAPRWIQQAGFEWAWRVAHEPRRLWKRYLVGNTSFIAMTARQWFRERR